MCGVCIKLLLVYVNILYELLLPLTILRFLSDDPVLSLFASKNRCCSSHLARGCIIYLTHLPPPPSCTGECTRAMHTPGRQTVHTVRWAVANADRCEQSFGSMLFTTVWHMSNSNCPLPCGIWTPV